MFLRVCTKKDAHSTLDRYERAGVKKLLVRSWRTQVEVHEGNVDLIDSFEWAILKVQLNDGSVETILGQTGRIVVTTIEEFNELSDIPATAKPGDRTAILFYANSITKLFNFLNFLNSRF